MYCQRKSNNLIDRIHERALRVAYNDYSSDIIALSLEVYKFVNNVSPRFMKEVFHLKQKNYSFPNQSLFYPNPRSEHMGLKHLATVEAKFGTIFPEKFKYVQI